MMLFNNIMKSGQVPTDWKEANVIPVFKSGCRNDATNYRPVSLKSPLSKVFETIVRDQVVEFLEVNKFTRMLAISMSIPNLKIARLVQF